MAMSNRPIILLDFDDVVVLNQPGGFGGYDVLAPNPPPELWSRLFHAPATQVLVEAVCEHQAQLVLTTSWLRFLPRDGFEQLLAKTGLAVLSASLHDAWEAPQNRGETRAEAIDRWLAAHHRGEPYVILDDELSGTGLHRSVHDKRGRLVLCKENVGLQREHVAAIRASLARPCEPSPAG
ncbi:HAD domain-containing protein [Hydrogenophaga sp. XSHU_21]